jgi:hypothetical protein
MAENSRIEDLRRRVERDPASIAFAQLAEECRRCGAHQEAVDVCRAGLAIHPGYLSARVTLGRALIELGQFDEARPSCGWCPRKPGEPCATAARRDHPRGDWGGAGAVSSGVTAPRNDPDLEEMSPICRGGRDLKGGPVRWPDLAHMQDELLKHAPPVAFSAGDEVRSNEIDAAPSGTLTSAADDRATRTVAALEQWLAAIHVSSDQRPA